MQAGRGSVRAPTHGRRQRDIEILLRSKNNRVCSVVFASPTQEHILLLENGHQLQHSNAASFGCARFYCSVINVDNAPPAQQKQVYFVQRPSSSYFQ